MHAVRLKTLRKKHRKTQEEVGKVLGITRQGYGMYELGKRNLDADSLSKLVEYYKVSPSYILGLTEDDTPYANDETATNSENYDLRFLLMNRGIKFNGEYLTDEEKARILGYLEGFKQN